MKKILTLTIISLLLSGCTGTKLTIEPIATEVEFSAEEKISPTKRYELGVELEQPVSELGMEVVQAIYNNDIEGNILFSPISLSLALGMLQSGAKGETQEEIVDVIGDKGDINENNKKVLQSQLSETEGLKLSLANSFWIREGMVPVQAYADDLKGFYDADMFSVDFMDISTVDQMNGWVEEKTRGMLKSTFEEFPEETVSVLMNTIYFKGTWIEEFSEKITEEEDFHINETDVKKVDMMHCEREMTYKENNFCQVAHLPYCDDMEMVVILPYQDMNTFLNGVGGQSLMNLVHFEDTRTVEVELSLPKFEYLVSNELNDVLKEIGMIKAFSSTEADFDGMVEGNPSVFVSRIFQNAGIILDEKGTEAAAVTVIATEDTCAMDEYEIPHVVMVCDKPFLYIIRDMVTGLPLFIGVYQAEEV